ncbi:MAG: outer membrane protein assembly factor BamE, partial [Pseudomonadota bacterium]
MNTASAGFVAALALGGALVAGCTPVRETHGWVSDTASEAQVQPGVDTRTTVLARMGSPSTTGSFG